MAKRLGNSGMRKVARDYPAAHTRVLTRAQLPSKPKSPLPKGPHGVTVSVRLGSRLYSVSIGAVQWRRIREGERFMARSRNWHRGRACSCYWVFDITSKYSLVVDCRGEGKRRLLGNICDTRIKER